MFIPTKVKTSCGDGCTCSKCMTYKDWCKENDDFSIADLEFGDIDYDIEALAPMFDMYYACWFVNKGCSDFVNELQLCYDMAKERIDAYYAKITDFVPNSHTKMTVDYGKRIATNKEYDYPVTNVIESTRPSNGTRAEADAVKDTTTVDKDEAPFKTLREFRDFSTFAEFFMAQFKDCFTLIEGATW